MSIDIITGSWADVDEAHLLACMRRIIRFGASVREARVYVNARKPDGWIEYTIVIEYLGSGGIAICAIQRAPGEPVEFHS